MRTWLSSIDASDRALLIAVTVVAISVVGLLVWSRWLTAPVTPTSLRRWREELSQRDDGHRRQAEVAWWAALHDGLLNGRLRRAARRCSGSGAILHGAMTEAEVAWRHASAAATRRRMLGPVDARPHLSDLLAGRLIPVLAVGADLAMAASVMENFDLGRDRSWLIAIPTASVMALAGRALGVGVRDRRPGLLVAGAISAWSVGAVLAQALARIEQNELAPSQYLVLVLAPVAVSALCAVLGHVATPGVKAADQELLLRRVLFWRSRRRLARALATAAERRTALTVLAAPRVIARPHVGANGDRPPIATHDVAVLLDELGVIVEPDLVERAHDLLDRLYTAADDLRPVPNLRSVA